jgi:hypothetical protein
VRAHLGQPGTLPGDRGEGPALSGCHRVPAGGCGEYAEKPSRVIRDQPAPVRPALHLHDQYEAATLGSAT